MSVLVVGAGGVGSMIAAILDHSGRSLNLLGRGSHFNFARASGMRANANGKILETSSRLTCLNSPADAEEKASVVVLAIKSFDTLTTLRSLAPLISPTTVFISLQNGVDNESLIQAIYPEATIVAGIINGHYSIPKPGEVAWEGNYGAVAGAWFSGDRDRARQAWQGLFQGTILPEIFVEGEGAAARIKWSKLVLNCGFNAINALTGLAPDQIIADPLQGDLATRSFQEAFSVMHAMGVESLDLPGAQIKLIEKICQKPAPEARRKLAMVTPKSSGNVASSMRQDLLQGRRATEILEINGAVTREGTRLAIPTPANLAIVDALKNQSSLVVASLFAKG